ncbi:unnamed protein product [Rotaria socialis]
MEELLGDNTKFKLVDNDSTITNEDQLIRLLSRLKKDNFITETEYKLHKENCPLRPVMSAIKTVNYGLGKMLTSRLSHLRQSQYVIKDSSDFVTKLTNTKNVDKLMISFDVVSLFTNVPLTFTVDYILDQLYPVCSTNCLQLSKSKQCVDCKRRIGFQTLLEIATSKTHLSFNNKIYVQHDGVAMGAPLAPIIADIFMAYLETTLMDELISLGVCEWHKQQFIKSSITSMTDRALRICSTDQLLSTEFSEIRKIAKLNDYPTSMVDTLIGIKFSKCRNKQQSNESTTKNSNDNRQIIYVEIPYVKTTTSELKKQTQHLARKTERQCIRRLQEHGAPRTTFNIQQQGNHDLDDSELRRSERLKNKTTTTTTTTAINLDQEQTSSIKKHIIETGHNMDWRNFNVVCQENHHYRLLVKELLLIQVHQSELNKTTHSIPLIVFPDGLSKTYLPDPAK